MKKFDIIVVGSGTAGSIAAYFGAKRGYKVCLLDGKPRYKIGDKICGDAIGSRIFDELGIPHPKRGEYLNIIDGAKLFPPDTAYSITIKDPTQAGYIVDRLRFGQGLMNTAIDAGAEQFDQTHAISLLFNKEQVTGVKIKSKNFNQDDFMADIVIDASGFHTQLRKQVNFPYLEKEIAPTDYIVCYREILRLKNPVVVDQRFISIYMDNKRAPGGYIWYFPRNEYEVNLGFGVMENHKSNLRDYYQKIVYEPFIGDEPCTRITGGSGLVSVCKPLLTGVANGILFVGDAAKQVNPITGGGLMSSMQAGSYTIQAYEKARESETFDALALWQYNLLFQKTIGAEFAALNLLRSAIQSFPNEVMNFAIKNRVVTGEEISRITTKGEISLSLPELLGKLLRGLSKPKLLLDLNYLRNRMGEIKVLYRNYPRSPSYLGLWVEQLEKINIQVRNRYGPSS